MKGFIRDLTNVASHMSENASIAQEYALYNAPIGVIIYDSNFRITWVNPSIKKIFDRDLIGESLEKIDSKLTPVLSQTMTQWQEVSLTNGYFRILHHHEFQAIYLYDITQDIERQKRMGEATLVMGTLLLDDYDDLIYALDDEESARFESDLISRLNRWADSHHIFLKQTDEDQFLLLSNYNSLKKLEEEKFDSIEQIKTYYYDQHIPISITISFSYALNQQRDILAIAKQVKSNLDLALGRGGDQVVIREQEGKARFYGGKSSFTENRSDIRAKMFFQALKGTILSYQEVLIAGHKSPDMDSLSSAIATAKIVEQMGRRTRVILNKKQLNRDLQFLFEEDFFKELTYTQFIDVDQLSLTSDQQRLLILVDHHKKAISEAEPIIDSYDTVIIDHHRQSEELMPNCVLHYLEPSASSTAELVTEYFSLVQEEDTSLGSCLSTMLLAGIVIDTNQFALRTGSRTFEAAAYLKSMGADNVAIQYLLKESLDTINTRNQLIEHAEFIDKIYAITVGQEKEILNTVLAAQTADDMLGIDQVEASFVIYRKMDNVIGISARSLGKINVQILMEELGGGGHLSNAATQIYDVTIDQAREQLIAVIKQKEEE